MHFYSPVSNTRCHSIGHKTKIARIKTGASFERLGAAPKKRKKKKKKERKKEKKEKKKERKKGTYE